MTSTALQCVPKTWYPAHFFGFLEQAPAGRGGAIYHGKL